MGKCLLSKTEASRRKEGRKGGKKVADENLTTTTLTVGKNYVFYFVHIPSRKVVKRICLADPVEETSPKAVKGSSQIR